MIRNRESIRKIFKNKTIRIAFISLIICGFCSSGSFAYLTSNANVDSNFKVKMGTLNIGIENMDSKDSKSIEISNIKPKTHKSDIFRIKNMGSLKEKIHLSFTNFQGVQNEDFIDKFEYIIKLQKSGDNFQEIRGNLKDLLNSKRDIKVLESNKELILKSEEEITGEFDLYLNENVSYKYEHSTFSFDLNATGLQINTKVNEN